MMHCAISRAHLASRSQQSEMMRTLRNRPPVWRHERFWRRSPLEGHGYPFCRASCSGEKQVSISSRRTCEAALGIAVITKAGLIFLAGVAFMDSVERCFAAVTAIGFFVTVVGVILLQTI